MKKMTTGHSPRRGRDISRERGRSRRRGRKILAPKRIEREYQYERGEERGVRRVNLKIPTFYGRSNLEEYLQYSSKIEHVYNCNNFSEERKLKLVVAEFCDHAIIW